MTSPHPSQPIGSQGETLVCDYLITQGWQVIARQWRSRWGEIDIVACQGSRLIFVEVKTRQVNSWDQGGRQAVDQRKQDKIARTSSFFLSQHPAYAEYDCQFDVALVEIHPKQLKLREYIPHAFELS
ncbi:MAG: YraN family protein [Cyanobacteriota bacterium]|nr:YraN family protein [Cyanobacteriota bacterium]